MSKLIGFLVLIAVSIPVTLLSGLVLSDLWDWFILPVFTVPPITFMQAVGLSLVVAFFKLGLATTPVSGEAERPIATGFAKLFGYLIVLLFIWGMGWTWAQFIT